MATSSHVLHESTPYNYLVIGGIKNTKWASENNISGECVCYALNLWTGVPYAIYGLGEIINLSGLDYLAISSVANIEAENTLIQSITIVEFEIVYGSIITKRLARNGMEYESKILSALTASEGTSIEELLGVVYLPLADRI